MKQEEGYVPVQTLEIQVRIQEKAFLQLIFYAVLAERSIAPDCRSGSVWTRWFKSIMRLVALVWGNTHGMPWEVNSIPIQWESTTLR